MTSVINRYYDPTTDQFLSIDPDVAFTNKPYVFDSDNTLNNTDPTGLCSLIGCGFASSELDIVSSMLSELDFSVTAKGPTVVAETPIGTVKYSSSATAIEPLPGQVQVNIDGSSVVTSVAGKSTTFSLGPSTGTFQVSSSSTDATETVSVSSDGSLSYSFTYDQNGAQGTAARLVDI